MERGAELPTENCLMERLKTVLLVQNENSFDLMISEDSTDLSILWVITQLLFSQTNYMYQKKQIIFSLFHLVVAITCVPLEPPDSPCFGFASKTW